VSFIDSETHESVISRWSRARKGLAKVIYYWLIVNALNKTFSKLSSFDIFFQVN
jgi:hypothetical protein